MEGEKNKRCNKRVECMKEAWREGNTYPERGRERREIHMKGRKGSKGSE